jgi:hypothetical protein
MTYSRFSAGLRPTSEAIVNRCMRSVDFGTIRPAATTLQHVHDPANDATIMFAPHTSHIGWRIWFDPLLCSSPCQSRFLLTIPILPQIESISYCQTRKINEF